MTPMATQLFNIHSVSSFLTPGLALLGVGLVIWLFKGRQTASPLPPGPTPLPIIGNILDFPKSKPWEAYSRLAEKYGKFLYKILNYNQKSNSECR